jgi:hypothetical protein
VKRNDGDSDRAVKSPGADHDFARLKGIAVHEPILICPLMSGWRHTKSEGLRGSLMFDLE